MTRSMDAVLRSIYVHDYSNECQCHEKWERGEHRDGVVHWLDFNPKTEKEIECWSIRPNFLFLALFSKNIYV
jgi:hypothetical protein